MNTFRPELIPLEDRALASVSALTTLAAPEGARTYLTDGGRTLVVSGGSAADAVTITDGRGALTVTGTDGRASVVYWADAIDTVAVTLRGGDDRFEYKTSGDVTRARQLRIDLGEGDDTSVVRWADDGSTAKANLTAVVSGALGSDAIGFRVGQLAPGVTATIRADGGAGDDALGIEALAPGRGAALDVALRGGSGNDSIGTYSTGDLAAGGRASYDLAGDTGDDSISVNAAGRIAGTFEVRADGGTGNDQLALVAVDVTGPRNLKVALAGGTGDDQLITLANARTVDIVADGGTGTDGGLIADGVKTRSVEQFRAPTNYELTPDPLPTFNPVLPTSTLARAGRTVEYYSAGTSKPGEPVVVLLTGFGGDIDYWQSVPAALASKSQVIAVNRPGYGKSSVTNDDYALATIEDIRAVVATAAPGRPVVLVGHSLGGLYANLFARLHPDEVAGVVFVDATAPEAVTRIDDAGIPFGGLGDPNDPALRLQDPGVRQEILGVVSLARGVLGAGAFPAVPVVSLRAGPADLLADDPQGDAWYEALGALGTPGETRRVPDSGHNIQYNRPDTVVKAVADVIKLVTTSATPTPPSALPLSQTVRDTLAEVRTATGVPAVAGGVIVDGQTAGLGAVGVREAGKPATVTDSDRFHLGSNAKSMTATLAAILVERGVIRWDTTVGQMFPELRGTIQPVYASATLEDLLNHRGGFGDFATLVDVAKYERFQKAARFASEGRQAYLRDWMTTVLPANPRGVYNYSNIGYAVAGAMMERAAHRGFEWLMRENVFQPLGMTSAEFGLPAEGGRRDQPLGHDENGNPIPVARTEPLDLLSPSGGVSMTMADWAKYLRMQLGETVNGVRLLSTASLAKLHTPDPRPITDDSGTYRYGFGWRTAETPLGEALGSEGAVPGFYSRVGIIPARGIAVFSAVNQLSDSAIAANAAVTDALVGRLAAKDTLTDALETARAKYALPAVAGGVVIDGTLAGVAATGVRENGNPTRVTADDQFHLGSNGKAMTATLAAVLVERGFVKWNTTLGQAFPELRAKMDPAYQNVTLEMLLNHRGGFRDENVSEDLFARVLAFKGNGYQARRAFLGDILATPAGAVGEFSYSNVGYTLAAAILERATGNAYEWLMQKYIFNPLGMTSAGFGPPGNGALDQPRGHDETGAPVGTGPGADGPAALNPAGLVHMSATDWSKFLRVHLGEKVNGVKLLSDAALTKLHTPDPRPTDAEGHLYGFGWVTIQTAFGPALWHNGSNGFWYSEAVIIPSKGVSAFVVSNQAGASGEAGVGEALANLLGRTAH